MVTVGTVWEQLPGSHLAANILRLWTRKLVKSQGGSGNKKERHATPKEI
jgi:hypothetical protein